MAEAAQGTIDEGKDHTVLLERYIECAEHLIQKCKELSPILGSGKLERKCAAELKYLRSLSRRRGGFDITHLRSSNLSHFAGVLHSADNLPHITHVLQAFSCPGRSEALHVDVVAGKGHIWVKVVARKAQALHLIWAGQGQYGERDIVLQAHDFVECSKVHPVNFVDPKVVFAFYNGVTSDIANKLEESGVIVIGEIVPVDINIKEKLKNMFIEDDESDEETSTLSNVDHCGTEMADVGISINELPSGKESSTLSSVDSHIDISETDLEKQSSEVQHLASDKHFLDETNRITSLHGKTQGACFRVNTLVQNQFLKNADSNRDKFDFSSRDVLTFIQTEILVKPIFDFGILKSIATANEINTLDKIGKVNLDITALITLVSAVSHGGCNFLFREKILSEQAAEERTEPVLPKLQAFLKGKIWYSSQTAVDSFKNILDTLGGSEERKRADDLLYKITVVPDKPSFRATRIPTTGKIKERSKIIFGTGDSLRAVTVTANSGFVRAAEHQGVTFAVFLHASRALTEEKELTAQKLNMER